MSYKFPKELVVVPCEDGHHWTLVKKFQFESDKLGTITCPKNMVTDFASIPPLNLIGVVAAIIGLIMGWSPFVGLALFVIMIAHLLLPTGSYTRAATIHDFLYSDRSLSRSDCDMVLYEAMVACKTIWWKRYLIWFNVRLFGWACWHGRRWKAYRVNSSSSHRQ